MIASITFLIITWIGWYFLLKARTTTNPWIADDGLWLYTAAGGTLTAGKWNTLVQRSARVDIPTADTDVFDVNCERRAKIVGWVWSCSYNHVWYLSMITGNGANLIVGRSGGTRLIDKAAKNKIYLNGTTYCNISSLQKRCY